ncbi:hypothetical protein [Paenarthrobacter sp. CAP02]|uniref:hypothetical protein n=1 Tax=Paenarthrobacter sp. CAP02 TaxID=3158144 RepID=UPI0032DA57A0
MSSENKFETEAANLNRTHLGRIIRFVQGDAIFQDTLAGISHEADVIEEPNYFQEVPDYALGRITTIVRLARAGSVHVAGSQPVELLP